jgi:uncharacterized protein with von Willebrand factor type A (vWA) domain
MYTQKQKECINFLESLVHQRFNFKTLIEKLSQYFNEEIKAEFVNEDDDTNDLSDWNIMFDSENEETYGYFDIYVLKHRKQGFDNTDFYVTEVGYEFE